MVHVIAEDVKLVAKDSPPVILSEVTRFHLMAGLIGKKHLKTGVPAVKQFGLLLMDDIQPQSGHPLPPCLIPSARSHRGEYPITPDRGAFGSWSRKIPCFVPEHIAV